MRIKSCPLSICLLAEKGESGLNERVRSLKKIAGQIMVAAMGADDGEIAAAEREGAEIYRLDWKDSFSEPKNFCLQRAAGRWVLFLHGNETIAEENFEPLHRILNNPNAEGYLIYSGYHKEGINSPVQSLRLLRNRKEYRFCGRSFETFPDLTAANLLDAPFSIQKTDDAENDWEHQSRSALLEVDLAEHPESAYLQYIHGIELLNQGQIEECISCFQNSLNTLNPEFLFAPHLYKCLSWSLLYRGRLEEAAGILEEGIRYFPLYTDLLVIRAELYKQLGRDTEAEQDLINGVDLLQRPSLFVPGPEISLADVFELAAEFYLQTHNERTALDCYRQAYELNPSKTDCLRAISCLACEREAAEVLESLLKKALEEKNPEQAAVLVEQLYQKREYARILSNQSGMESVFGQNEGMEFLSLSCRMMTEDRTDSDFIRQSKSAHSVDFLKKRIQNCWMHNRWRRAEKLIGELSCGKGTKEADFYRFVQGLLTGKAIPVENISLQQLDFAETLHGDFLWRNMESKAKALLPLLLSEPDDDRLIRLAEAWAGKNRFSVIRQLFQQTSDRAKKTKLKQRSALLLVLNGRPQTARRVIQLDDSPVNTDLNVLVESECLLDRAKREAGKILPGSASHRETVPSGLREFAESMCGTETKLSSDCEDLSCAQLHEKISDFYLKNNQKKEAFFACLRALQWEPSNHRLQKKAAAMIEKNHALLSKFRTFDWATEGPFFENCRDFISFLYGILFFQKQQYDRALRFFFQPSQAKSSQLVFLAYRMAAFWLTGKKIEAVSSQLPAEFGKVLMDACKSAVCNQLEKTSKSLQYRDFLQMELEKIRAAKPALSE